MAFVGAEKFSEFYITLHYNQHCLYANDTQLVFISFSPASFSMMQCTIQDINKPEKFFSGEQDKSIADYLETAADRPT